MAPALDAPAASGGVSVPPEPLTVTSDGLRLAGLLYRPCGQPRGALLVCHGAGSRKENHALMGEQAAAAGLAALTYDARGHGESEGLLDPAAWHDVAAAARALLAASGAPWVAARGTSMGGCLLLLAAGADPGLFRSLVLLCPADGGSLLRGLDRLEAEGEDAWGGDYHGRFDAAALRPWLGRLDLLEAAHGLSRVLLVHARDDDEVPYAHSERLAGVVSPPSRFVTLDEGGHHAPGRSPLVARETLEWVRRCGEGAAAWPASCQEPEFA
jgi:pimeloyl-ACP methyl ester carboxylesterase